jgi:hypothetical protein
VLNYQFDPNAGACAKLVRSYLVPAGCEHAKSTIIGLTRWGSSASGWVPLPRSHNYVVKSTARGVAGILSKVQGSQDALAGKTSDAAAPLYGNLTFDRQDSLPVVTGDHVVIVYIGPLTPITAEQLARNPELQNYPVMELAPMKTDQRGYRYAPLYEIAPGVIAFAQGRVPATIELTERSALIFRCTGPLTSGR